MVNFKSTTRATTCNCFLQGKFSILTIWKSPPPPGGGNLKKIYIPLNYLSPIIVETREAALSIDLKDGVGDEEPTSFKIDFFEFWFLCKLTCPFLYQNQWRKRLKFYTFNALLTTFFIFYQIKVQMVHLVFGHVSLKMEVQVKLHGRYLW